MITLGAPHSLEASLVGAKAAALAAAMDAGLPVLPGFVITTHATASLSRELAHGFAPLSRSLETELKSHWVQLRSLSELAIVRSSSTEEDGADSSMAGMFTSVTSVRTWNEFLEAVQAVLASARVIRLDHPSNPQAPMAVLVQPQIEPAVSGVMFGADPITGRDDRIVISVVEGRPEELVSGEVSGSEMTISSRGRVIDRSRVRGGLQLGRSRRVMLASLAQAAARNFGGPQDMEWAIDPDGRLWMFQSRPITTLASAAAGTGPVMGPGPVAETFPEPLSPLEQDMWLPPLRLAIFETLLLTGAASRKRIEASPVVTSIGGRVAADLELLGVRTKKRTLWNRIDPRPPCRRLAAAWRVGRVTAALPIMATEMIAAIDHELRSVPAMAEYNDNDLVDLLQRCRRVLLALHSHEMLCGSLLETEAGTTGAAAALGDLASARAQGIPDDQIAAHYPNVLMLMPPGLAGSALPPGSPNPMRGGMERLPLREQLRMRARWIQELQAIAVSALGTRWHRGGKLDSPEHISRFSVDELGRALALDDFSPATRAFTQGAPLPSAFQLTSDDAVVPVISSEHSEGRGAGGGRVTGCVVHQDSGAPPPGSILVVQTLDPQLANYLPRLAGLVAETGSLLSHLAILAREYQVPTVVAYEGAVSKFPVGAEVLVDGATGEVSLLDAARSAT